MSHCLQGNGFGLLAHFRGLALDKPAGSWKSITLRAVIMHALLSTIFQLADISRPGMSRRRVWARRVTPATTVELLAKDAQKCPTKRSKFLRSTELGEENSSVARRKNKSSRNSRP